MTKVRKNVPIQTPYKQDKLVLSLSVISIFYIIFSLLTVDPSSLAKYHLSISNARLLLVTILFPYMAIWFVGLYGYLKVKEYAQYIKDSKDGKQFNTLARGLLYLVLGLPISGIITMLSTYYARLHPGFLPTSTILNNYIGLALVLFAFHYISNGARGMSDLVKRRPSLNSTRILVFVFMLIAGLYSYMTFGRENSALIFNAKKNPYYLPTWLILTTIVVPYLYVWFTGLQAAMDLYIYRVYVKGVLYKRALGQLAFGCGFVIVGLIFSQFLTSLTSRVNRLSLGSILVVLYVFLLLRGLGFLYIAIGSKKLKKIEEV